MANLNDLHPHVKRKAEELLINANKRIKNGGYEVIITQGYRSKEEQNRLYMKGRSGNQGPIVTNARGGTSMHNFGLAIDFALRRKDNKKIVVWNREEDFDEDGKADWMEVVAEAKKLGFAWGGDFRSFKDYPHFQMLGGLTEKEVRSGHVPDFGETAKLVQSNEVKRNHISDVQNSLNKKYNLNIKVDGLFGKGTKKALVTALQTELNKREDTEIKVDGIFGKQTKEAAVSVRFNSSGNYVWVIQAMLNCLGYETNGIDGIFGKITGNAVLKFQKDNGLQQFAIVDKDTLEKLFT